MCGIAALFCIHERANRRIAARSLARMTRAVDHRGPDGEGIASFGANGALSEGAAFEFGLGHRRLSIIDLSDAGKQPMERGRLVTTYNGEIYNYVELRTELSSEGQVFATQSDTEVLLAAYEAWGERAFARLRGMWGFVLVDRAKRVAYLCRDRLGIKPLYTFESGGYLAVVSEPKQLAHAPQANLLADVSAVAAYLSTGYEDPHASMFQGVTPVPPGTYRRLDLDTGKLGPPTPYWSPESIVPTITARDEASHVFASVFREAVRIHMRSDVPVGCALSGGLDSSAVFAVAAELAAKAGRPLHTFSVTFPGFAHDERRFVDAVLERVPAQAHFATPTADELVADFDRFVYIHDEPVGSLSQYAAYVIARTTRAHGVPVSLNGQGGDEVLSGYWQTYMMHLARLARTGDGLALVRELGGALLPAGNAELLRAIPGMTRRAVLRMSARGEVSLRDVFGTHRSFARQVMAMDERERRVFEIRELTLPRLLKWDDRNFMAFSVEGRYPFLDHEVIEACLAMNRSALVGAGWTKEPIRRGLADMLPQSIARRKTKIGFETPQSTWLRGPLRPVVDSLMRHDSPVHHWVEPAAIRTLVSASRRARAREEAQALFRVLNVDRWMRVLSLEVAA